MTVTLLRGDCLTLLRDVPDRSVHLILCDLPYGCTPAEWDRPLPPDRLWREYARILVRGGNVALFGTNPFTAELICSNRRHYAYSWIWRKRTVSGFQLSQCRPLMETEDIAVFTYPVDTSRNNDGWHMELRQWFLDELAASGLRRCDVDRLLGNQMSSHYFTRGREFSIPSEGNYLKLQGTGRFQRPYSEIKAEWTEGCRAVRAAVEHEESRSGALFFPQGLVRLEKPLERGARNSPLFQKLFRGNVQRYTNYPRNILEFPKDAGNFHSTQKPVALLSYLIRTYTREGMTVLDNCMGSGSTGVACVNTGRSFIGMEKDEGFFRTAQERIAAAETFTEFNRGLKTDVGTGNN